MLKMLPYVICCPKLKNIQTVKLCLVNCNAGNAKMQSFRLVKRLFLLYSRSWNGRRNSIAQRECTCQSVFKFHIKY